MIFAPAFISLYFYIIFVLIVNFVIKSYYL